MSFKGNKKSRQQASNVEEPQDDIFGTLDEDNTVVPDTAVCATAFKNVMHISSKPGFTITLDNLIRCGWKHMCTEADGCDAETNPDSTCTRFQGVQFQQFRPKTVNDGGKKGEVQRKVLKAFDIGANIWISILGLTEPRRFDQINKRYSGLWKKEDWDAMNSGKNAGVFKPHRHVRVMFLHPVTLEPMHTSPIQIRLDGMFGSSFWKVFRPIRDALIRNNRGRYPHVSDDKIMAHIPLKIQMTEESHESASSKKSYTACFVKAFRTPNSPEGYVKFGSDTSNVLMNAVDETTAWKESIMQGNFNTLTDIAEEEVIDPMSEMSYEAVESLRETQAMMNMPSGRTSRKRAANGPEGSAKRSKVSPGQEPEPEEEE
jgi:hypothetical protein